jgi:hypothetical protein
LGENRFPPQIHVSPKNDLSKRTKAPFFSRADIIVHPHDIRKRMKLPRRNPTSCFNISFDFVPYLSTINSPILSLCSICCSSLRRVGGLTGGAGVLGWVWVSSFSSKELCVFKTQSFKQRSCVASHPEERTFI